MNVIFSKDISELKGLLQSCGKVFIVYDSLAAHIAEFADFPKMAVEASEKGKNIDIVLKICKWLLEEGADRDCLLLAVGGGIVCDMAGFAASIYKRGIRFACFPTTLLAMADAAIGGKNGVNFEGYKNMLGCFREPEFTFECPKVLESLPEREFRCGIAEILKAAVISDDWMFYDSAVELFSENTKDKIMASEALLGELSGCIKKAVELKIAIVGKDFLDKGERRKLNLGHTFAHAIESVAAQKGDDIKHGEAVAMGIVLAAQMALEKGLCEDDFVEMIRMDFEDCGLPVICPYDMEELSAAIEKDKKSSEGEVHFVLPCDLGDVRIL